MWEISEKQPTKKETERKARTLNSRRSRKIWLQLLMPRKQFKEKGHFIEKREWSKRIWNMVFQNNGGGRRREALST